MPTNSNIQNELIASVTKAVNVLYTAIMRRLSSAEYPDAIAANTKTTPATEKDKVITGSIIVDASPNAAPMALAFEIGSGIWAEQGTRQKYPIEPTEASILAFNWPEAENIAKREGVDLVNFGPGGKAFLPKVMHPGIKAKPYIQPSIEEKLDEIADIIGDDFVLAISAELGPDLVVIK